MNNEIIRERIRKILYHTCPVLLLITSSLNTGTSILMKTEECKNYNSNTTMFDNVTISEVNYGSDSSVLKSKDLQLAMNVISVIFSILAYVHNKLMNDKAKHLEQSNILLNDEILTLSGVTNRNSPNNITVYSEQVETNVSEPLTNEPIHELSNNIESEVPIPNHTRTAYPSPVNI